MGKNMKHALRFCRKHPHWHTFDGRSRATKEAIRRLALRDLVIISGTQFRLKD